VAGSAQAWERVLTAIEADTRRAEALLQAAPADLVPDTAPAIGSNGDRPRGVPAEWLVPVASELPPLDTMPPVPAELSDRILGLRGEIIRLQSELAAAMRDIPRQQARIGLQPAAEPPSFIDRRL
jgi:hypothetical protein